MVEKIEHCNGPPGAGDGQGVFAIWSRISDAIHTQSLGEMATAMLREESAGMAAGELRLLESAIVAVNNIRRSLLTRADEVTDRLRRASITCRFDDADEHLRFPQYHQYRVAISADDPTPAVECLRDMGYWHPIPPGDPGWDAFVRDGSRMVLTRLDEDSTRLDLQWNDGRVSGAGTPRGLFGPRPSTGTLRLFAKAALRVPARIRSRCAKRAPQQSLGELLGTPKSLLPPLFSFAALDRSDVLLDIGCGDGRVVVEASRQSGCRAIGVERQRQLCEFARQTAQDAGVEDRVEIIQGDAQDIFLDGVTVVFLFVPVRVLGSILPTLLEGLGHGARVVTHEQVPLDNSLRPTRSRPIISESAVTVAHRWDV